jgi:hypothetical protein
MTIATKQLKSVKLAAKATAATAGRVHSVSSKSLPRVDAEAKARLEEAARKPATRRKYPELA